MTVAQIKTENASNSLKKTDGSIWESRSIQTFNI